LQEKYPHISRYAYTFSNPVKYIDLTGMDGDDGDSVKMSPKLSKMAEAAKKTF